MISVVVTGGRRYANREHVFRTLDWVHDRHYIALLIHGACGRDADDPLSHRRPIRGADGLADDWATGRGVKVDRVLACWKALGGSAGPRRNRLMMLKRPDLVVAFPGDRGTANAIEQARKLGLIVLCADEDARRTDEDAREGFRE